jgi:hypothetical protein
VSGPLSRSASFVMRTLEHTDTRDDVVEWINRTSSMSPNADVAVAGPLQLPISVFSISGVDAFNPAATSVARLAQQGVRFFVVGTGSVAYDEARQFLHEAASFEGESGNQRVPNNPAITIFEASLASHPSEAAQRAPSTLSLLPASSTLAPLCDGKSEEYCWVTSLHTLLSLEKGSELPSEGVPIRWALRTPWPDQRVVVRSAGGDQVLGTELQPGADWFAVSTDRPIVAADLPLHLIITEAHAPSSRASSSDTRRLGIAIRPVP